MESTQKSYTSSSNCIRAARVVLGATAQKDEHFTIAKVVKEFGPPAFTWTPIAGAHPATTIKPETDAHSGSDVAQPAEARTVEPAEDATINTEAANDADWASTPEYVPPATATATTEPEAAPAAPAAKAKSPRKRAAKPASKAAGAPKAKATTKAKPAAKKATVKAKTVTASKEKPAKVKAAKKPTISSRQPAGAKPTRDSKTPLRNQPQMKLCIKLAKRQRGVTVPELQEAMGGVQSPTVRGAISRLRGEGVPFETRRVGKEQPTLHLAPTFE